MSSPPAIEVSGAPLETTSNVTFEPSTATALNADVPRVGSVGNNLASVNASARTSYTRVADSIDADHPPHALPPSDVPPPAEGEPVDAIPHTPQVNLTFLLVSGQRRTMTFEPTQSVGRVKELLWTTWPSDTPDERPPAPSFLRVLYRGRVLQDDSLLKDVPFPIDTPPTIAHLSIRPGVVEDDMAGKDFERQPSCCGCVIC
ncbi:hypothetical protein CYLTODRAFT_399491 [Cylindrobasidium torrendii FP15055 ss-10]|uniref:Ubiquitin-like domain-containing protein n=1 Tax=Cylindrobasidium torrendii FP15055 ss-10 TaxID=1314674 RepID=A0A0D7B712_9AGAR|nr:hypothetical protein CYLTODRAFT_399491 [Cylindrobasidium torrendii FP15055 ss-10]